MVDNSKFKLCGVEVETHGNLFLQCSWVEYLKAIIFASLSDSTSTSMDCECIEKAKKCKKTKKSYLVTAMVTLWIALLYEI